MPGEIDHGKVRCQGVNCCHSWGDKQTDKLSGRARTACTCCCTKGGGSCLYPLSFISHPSHVHCGPRFCEGAAVVSGPGSPRLAEEARPRTQEHSTAPDMSGGGCPPGCRTPIGMGSPPRLRAASFRSCAWLHLRVDHFCFFVKHFFFFKSTFASHLRVR